MQQPSNAVSWPGFHPAQMKESKFTMYMYFLNEVYAFPIEIDWQWPHFVLHWADLKRVLQEEVT